MSIDPTTPITPVQAEPSVQTLPLATLGFAHQMFDAARSGNLELLKAAIEHQPKGLPVNLTNDKGNTLLMLAAYAGHTELVNYLISTGASPDALNDLGQSPIAGAVFKGHDDVVKSLAAAGANPRAGQPSAVQAAHMFHRHELMSILGTRPEDADKEVPASVIPLPSQ